MSYSRTAATKAGSNVSLWKWHEQLSSVVSSTSSNDQAPLRPQKLGFASGALAFAAAYQRHLKP